MSEYNGWKNYETWAVGLWIDNDEGTHLARRELARESLGVGPNWDWQSCAQAELDHLADALSDWVTEYMIPNLGASLAGDLLNAAVSEVDWRELAENYLEEAREEAEVDA